MAKILIYKEVVPNGEYDIFHMIDYRKFSDTVIHRYNSCCPNIGNRAWLQGIIVALQDGNNTLEFLAKEMTTEYINSEYDFIVLPMANIFHIEHIAAMERLADVFEKITVPTFVIACGAQAESFDKLEELIDTIKEPASRFIKSIYATGGEFALRGYFTKEFFDKLGFRSAVVTGCPSLYQLGPELKIKENFLKMPVKAVFNGKLQVVGKYLSQEDNALYIDQDEYFNLVFAIRDKKQSDYKYIKNQVKRYGFEAVKYTVDQKLLFFTDIPVWRKYLIDNNYNFSYGSRIHGNIISILSGIPALVYAGDSRTREMAEFFSIPLVMPSNKNYSLEELCDLTDYKSFNQNFRKNYEQFYGFLKNHGLVCNISKKNIFFEQEISLSPYIDFVYSLFDPYRDIFNNNRSKLYHFDQKERAIRFLKKAIYKIKCK